MISINEMNVEQLEKELQQAIQSAAYVEEEIPVTRNEDLYKYAQEFYSYANKVSKRLEKLKEME